MAGFYEDRVCLFRLFTALHFVGKSFLNLFGFTSVAKKYVCGNKEEFVGGEQSRLDGDDTFVRETESLLNLFSRAWRCWGSSRGIFSKCLASRLQVWRVDINCDAVNLVLTTSWKRKLATSKGKKADVSSVSPSSERLEKLWVVCRFICKKWSCAIGHHTPIDNQLFHSLWRPIYVFNSVVRTKLPAIHSHRHSTTVSLETNPLKSTVASRSIRVESSRFDNICNLLSWPLTENFRSALQIDFRYDMSTSTVTSRSIRVDNTFNDSWKLLAEYFLSVLQVTGQL